MSIDISMINTCDFCKRCFYYRYIEKRREQVGEIAIAGKDLHDAFNHTLATMDIATLMGFGIEESPDKSGVYTYLKEKALARLVNPIPRVVQIVQNWACHFARYWYELHEFPSIFNNKEELEFYFKPIMMEQKIELKDEGLFGTPDLVMRVPTKDSAGKPLYLILDYKTGGVPVAVLRGESHIDTKKSLQLHMYAHLVGKVLGVEERSFLVGILYLGYALPNYMDKQWPFAVIKKTNARSFKTLQERIANLKECVKKTDIENWPAKYNDFQCNGYRGKDEPNPCEYIDICYRPYKEKMGWIT